MENVKHRLHRSMAAGLLALAGALSPAAGWAQLSTNPDKFLGNITTRYNMDYNGFQYYKYWNQVTCENESKWGSCEGTNGSYNWGGADNAYNYAKQHKFPFKWHALIWGAQHPGWFNSTMAPEQRYKEIVQWMDAVKKKYPNLEIIDVANECIAGHQADTYLFQEALGGSGDSGWDWLAKAFEMAHERWPNAILIYNDYNTFLWNTDEFINVCKTLRDLGAPIDAYGCQSHDLTDCSLTNFKSAMNKIQTALKMPMYSTEYDIGTGDDNKQLQRYKEQIPVMWEADYCAGITLWGWHYGCTWTTDGNSGIIRANKTNRPAMDWLIDYMKTDKAKTAKSPFPGMVKEASVYVKPTTTKVQKNKPTAINVRAKMRTKTIEKVELYAGTLKVGEMTEPTNPGEYIFEYTSSSTGTKSLKAVVTCTDGFTWTRYSEVSVVNPSTPYKTALPELPGTLELENFDKGADGIAFHDNNSSKQGDGKSYRSDTGGVDVIKVGSGYGLGYTEVGEWMEYTLDVKEAGYYDYALTYSAPESGAAIYIAQSGAAGRVMLTDAQQVLATTGDWSSYQVAHGRLLLPLEEGKQTLRIGIAAGASQYVVNLDKIVFSRVDVNEDIKLTVKSTPAKVAAEEQTLLQATVTSAEADVQKVTFYADGVEVGTATEAPYEVAYTTLAKGTCKITAVATDAQGKESKVAAYSLTVTAKRTPYKGAIPVPGVIEAEDFDMGEEGLTWHDNDDEVHDDANYRTDKPKPSVDVVAGNDGYVIGWTNSNEWVEYTIEVANTGIYTCEMVASNGTSTSASVSVQMYDDSGKLSTLWSLSRSGTSAWGTYKSSKSGVKKQLEAGTHVIRVTFKNGNVNLDKLILECVEDLTPVEDIYVLKPKEFDTSSIFDLSGRKVDANYRGIVIKNGKKIWQR